MTKTDNFDLNIVEGSDKVNLLTQMNPNTEIIDAQMFRNQNMGVQTATELLSGTIHAITRNIPDASMFRFTAVSKFTAGDTFTVDGVQVSALLPSGEQLPDGAFIIGSEVLAVLKGTLLTVFASGGSVANAKDSEKLGGELPSYYATKTEVDNARTVATSAGNVAEDNKLALDNGNIMFTVMDGVPMWKERGADTYNPFNTKGTDLLFDGDDLTRLDGDFTKYDYIAFEYIGYYNALTYTTNSMIAMFPIPFDSNIAPSRPYLNKVITTQVVVGNGDFLLRKLTISNSLITLDANTVAFNASGYKIRIKKIYGIKG